MHVAEQPGWMRVRLTRKLADEIDGIDLSNHDVGDVLDLPESRARILVAEAWAEGDRRQPVSRHLVIAFRRQDDLGHHGGDEDEAVRPG